MNLGCGWAAPQRAQQDVEVAALGDELGSAAALGLPRRFFGVGEAAEHDDAQAGMLRRSSSMSCMLLPP